MYFDSSKWKRPEPYEPGESQFWTDPYISTQMLQAHLDPNTDAASFRPERIDAVCAFLRGRLGLGPSRAVVDLGCGPGLYSRRLSESGCAVTGIDFSENSIVYATKQSAGEANSPQYRVADYLEWSERQQYDAALLIYEDFGVPSPSQRKKLLGNIHQALRPGGLLALDVASVAAYRALERKPPKRWSLQESGFWRPHRHLELYECFLYPDIPAVCNQYAVIDDRTLIYRIFLTYYSPETIGAELLSGGFVVEDIYSSLAGDAWRPDSPQLGVICRKI